MLADKELKERARLLKPVLAIGKNGITQGSITLLARELEQRKLVKVRLLPAFIDQPSGRRDRKNAAMELARLARARLVSVVGNVVVLYKPERG